MPHLSRFLSGLALMLTLPLSGCLDTGPDVVCVDVERVLSQSRPRSRPTSIWARSRPSCGTAWPPIRKN